jgi:hypothetical protein
MTEGIYHHPSSFLSCVYKMQIPQLLCFDIDANWWGGIPPSSPEFTHELYLGSSRLFAALRNQARLPRVSSSNRVLAAHLFLLVTNGHATKLDNSASRVPVPFPRQKISDFFSTREKRRMPSAAPGIRGVKL